MHKASSRLWRLVFWFWVAGLSLYIIALPFQSPSFWDVISAVIAGVSLIPMYGFAYQTAVGDKIIAVVIFLLNAPAAVYAAWLAPQYFGGANGIIFPAIGLAVMATFVYPLFAYAFLSNHIWHSSNA